MVALVSPLKYFLIELKKRNLLLFYWGIAIFVLTFVLGLLFVLCSDGVTDVCYWAKPIKFTLSFGIYLWTIAWFIQYLKLPRKQVKLLSWAIAIFVLLEIGIILLQNVGGISYHIDLPVFFNAPTHYLETLKILGNVLILANTLIVIGIAALFFRKIENLPPAYLWGIRLGFLVFLFSCFEGEYILLKYGQVPTPTSALGMPFANLNTPKGALIAAHFIGIHSLQLLPLLGYLQRKKENATLTIFIIAGLYLLTMAYLIWL